jgi:hypothetical protein
MQDRRIRLGAEAVASRVRLKYDHLDWLLTGAALLHGRRDPYVSERNAYGSCKQTYTPSEELLRASSSQILRAAMLQTRPSGA